LIGAELCNGLHAASSLVHAPDVAPRSSQGSGRPALRVPAQAYGVQGAYVVSRFDDDEFQWRVA